MFWSSIVGQDAAVGFLRRALATERLQHFMLLWGPPGVGKRKAATALAAAALCRDAARADPSEACGECAACREFQRGVHPDFLLPSVAGEKEGARALTDDDRQITLEKTVRPLVADAALMSARGGRRVVFIRRAERINAVSQNTLLKTLEEPRGDRLWMLTAEDPSRLLPTVRSRGAAVRFGRVETRLVAGVLVTERGVPAERAERAARAAEGSFSRAEELLSEEWEEEQRFLLEEVIPRMGAGPREGPSLARALVERAASAGGTKEKAREKKGAAAGAAGRLERTRVPALRTLGALELLLRERLREAMLSGSGGAEVWARRIEAVLASDAAIRQNLRVELALSVAAARLASAGRAVTPEAAF